MILHKNPLCSVRVTSPPPNAVGLREWNAERALLHVRDWQSNVHTSSGFGVSGLGFRVSGFENVRLEVLFGSGWPR